MSDFLPYLLVGLLVIGWFAVVGCGLGYALISFEDGRPLRAVLAAAVATVTAAAGIGFVIYSGRDTGPAAGYVTGRDHDAAWVQQVCSTANGATTCTPVHHPERFRLRLEDGDHEGWVTVNAAVYDRCTDGAWCDPDDPTAGPPA